MVAFVQMLAFWRDFDRLRLTEGRREDVKKDSACRKWRCELYYNKIRTKLQVLRYFILVLAISTRQDKKHGLFLFL